MIDLATGAATVTDLFTGVEFPDVAEITTGPLQSVVPVAGTLE